MVIGVAFQIKSAEYSLPFFTNFVLTCPYDTFEINILPRDACDGGKRDRGQELPFPSLLSCEGAFSGIIAGLVQENFLGKIPQTLNFTVYNYETNRLTTIFPRKSLKTNKYPCGGTYTYEDVPSEEALRLLLWVRADVPDSSQKYQLNLMCFFSSG